MLLPEDLLYVRLYKHFLFLQQLGNCGLYTFDKVFPGDSVVKNQPAMQERQEKWFDPWLEKIRWRRKWQPIPVFFPGESHWQRSLAGYSPRGPKKVEHNLVNIGEHVYFSTSVFVFVGYIPSSGIAGYYGSSWRRRWYPTPVLLLEKIPWVEESGGLQSMGSWRVGHDWANSLSLFTFMHWRRRWQPTPVFLPGESQGWGSLVGCLLWGHTESDTTEAT